MWKKNDSLFLNIEDLSVQGEGIGRADGMPFFIRGAIPGDRIRAGVTRMQKTYGYARLTEILAPSPDRVAPPCAVADKCGGCQLMHMSYEAQLRTKMQRVRQCLQRIGGFSEETIRQCVQPLIGMDQPLRSRNKGQYPVGTDKDGQIVTGFYAFHSHRIIPTEDCLLQQENHREILERVRRWMKQAQVSAYDEVQHTGLIRHVMIRNAMATGQIMVCIVANGDRLPQEERLRRALSEVPGMTSVVLNINRRRTNVILGEETRVIWGSETIADELLGNTFRISARSFYQVNPRQTEILYGIAEMYAGLTGAETVWDLYCGIGTISLTMAREAKQVVGIEIVPEAIEDAKKNAAANGIDNAAFYCGAAELVLPQLVADGVIPRPDVVVVDPPRKGCDAACLQTILAASPARIVYVSCDPATLARDLRTLCDGGYRLEKCQPVDQFGFSCHVETVCLLIHN